MINGVNVYLWVKYQRWKLLNSTYGHKGSYVQYKSQANDVLTPEENKEEKVNTYPGYQTSPHHNNMHLHPLLVFRIQMKDNGPVTYNKNIYAVAVPLLGCHDKK